MAESVIQRVRSTTNMYTQLGVSRSATTEEIKKAYKRCALLLHPDKCQLPGAEDAFKQISRAHECLSDAAKRRTYDQYGEDGLQAEAQGGSPAHAARRAQQQRYGFGQQQYYRPEADLFDELFAGLFGQPNRAYARRQQQQQQQQQYARQQQQRGRQEEPAIGLGFFMILPVLLFIAMNFVLSMSTGSSSSSGFGRGAFRGGARPTDLYSLTRNGRGGFTRSRTIDSLPELQDTSIEYFVRGDFEHALHRHGFSLRHVELNVARDQRDSLARRCKADLERDSRRFQRTSRPRSCIDYDKLRQLPTV